MVHHLRLEATVARAEAGLPHAAPLAARLEWLWQCHLHVWAFRCAALVGDYNITTRWSLRTAAVPALLLSSQLQTNGVSLHVACLSTAPLHRLLAGAAALCSLAIVVAEATIAGVLPNLSIVSVVLRNTAGGWD